MPIPAKSSLDRDHGRVVKMRFSASSSTATPVNIASPGGAVHRTEPTKSDVSVRVNISSMYWAGTIKLSGILGFWRRNWSALERRINNLGSVQSAEEVLKSVNLTAPSACLLRRSAGLGIGDWVTFYNHRRPHSAHGGETPAGVYCARLSASGPGSHPDLPPSALVA